MNYLQSLFQTNCIYENHNGKIFITQNKIFTTQNINSMGGQQSQEVQYCYPMPNSKQAGFTPIFRNPKFKDLLSSSPDPSLKTYRELVLRSFLDKFPNKRLAGRIITTKTIKDGQQTQQKQVQYMTYKQCFQRAELLGKAIIGLQLYYKETIRAMKFIGIYSRSRTEWLVTDLACLLYGLTSVPMCHTLEAQNLTYCLRQTQVTTVFLSTDDLRILLSLEDHGNLNNVILFDHIGQQLVKKANKAGLSVLGFNALVQQGKMFPDINYRDFNIEPNDIYTLSYTSEMIGPPKGAMLSHLNFTSFVAALNNHDLRFQGDDVYVTFLPLSHLFQRLITACLMFAGARIVFFSGDVLRLRDDCKVVRPTVFCAQSGLYNQIVEKFQEGFEQQTGLFRCLVDSAVSSKNQNIQKDGNFNHAIYDNLVFSKAKEAFGGRIRQFISTSTPLPKNNFQFMQMVMSCPLYQVYGQTQSTGAAFVRYQKDPTIGHIGGVISSLQFRLADIPEMKYTSQDVGQHGKHAPRGQIWLRGPAVIQGYYKLTDKTEQVITKDGWLKTGDVGVLLAQGGRMRIIDRKKNIFKLQQGQFIAPNKVQNVYNKSPYVQEVFLHGESSHDFCVAVVKPRKQHFLDLANKNNINGNYQELCENEQMRKVMIEQLFNLGKSSGLNTFQEAKNIYLESSSFADKKILTNTMELQRLEARKVYKNIFQLLYTQGQLSVR